MTFDFFLRSAIHRYITPLLLLLNPFWFDSTLLTRKLLTLIEDINYLATRRPTRISPLSLSRNSRQEFKLASSFKILSADFPFVHSKHKALCIKKK